MISSVNGKRPFVCESIVHIQKQPFADVLQNSYSWKFYNIYRIFTFYIIFTFFIEHFGVCFCAFPIDVFFKQTEVYVSYMLTFFFFFDIKWEETIYVITGDQLILMRNIPVISSIHFYFLTLFFWYFSDSFQSFKNISGTWIL